MAQRKMSEAKTPVKNGATRKANGSSSVSVKKSHSPKSHAGRGEATKMLEDIEIRARISIDRAHAVIAKLA